MSPTEKYVKKMVNDLQSKAVCISVEMGVFSVKRKLDSRKIQTDSDSDKIHTQKSIIDCDEYRNIVKLDTSVRQWLYTRCLPIGRRGIYLLPVKILDDSMAYLQKYQDDRKELVDLFLKVYPDEVNNARKFLRSNFDEDDYPTVERLKQRFWVSVSMFELSAPSVLKNANAEAYSESMKQLQKMWDEARSEVVGTLYEELNDLANHLLDRLESKEDGGRKKFNDSVVTNLGAWLELFDARNLTDDTKLNEIVGKIRSIIGGVDADDLRSSNKLREKVAESFKQVKAEVDKQVSSIARRKFAID